MDRETERLLNLYLDGQLTGVERKAFEIRLENEPQLRKAVALHREAAAGLRRMPDLPDGFADRARERLDRALPQKTAGRFWHRSWSLETAGLLAAAGIVVAVLYPFLRPDETGQLFTPEPQLESALPSVAERIGEDTGPGAGNRLPEEEALLRQASPDDERKNKITATSELRRTEPPADSPSEKDESREDTRTSFSDEYIEGLPVIGREYVDVLTLEPGVQDEDGDGNVNILGSRGREVLISESGVAEEAQKAEEPETPSRQQKAAPQTMEQNREAADRVAGTADLSTTGAPAPSTKKEAAAVRFRVVDYPGTADLGDANYRALKTEAETALMRQAGDTEAAATDGFFRVIPKDDRQKAKSLGFDPEKDMGILLTARKEGDPAVRIEVVQVHQTATALIIGFRETPISRKEESDSPTTAYQVVIVSATDLDIQLKKID